MVSRDDDREDIYPPRPATNCKFSIPTTRQERRLRSRARRDYARLLHGMDGYQCYWITLIKGRGLDLNLRRDAWHPLLTRLRQHWKACEAWTGYEWGPRRGVHLNVVLKGTPGLTKLWLDHVVGRLHDGTQVGHFTSVNAPQMLARYVTKELGHNEKKNAWPRGFRVVTTTRNWCPGWMNPAQWRAHRRNPLTEGLA